MSEYLNISNLCKQASQANTDYITVAKPSNSLFITTPEVILAQGFWVDKNIYKFLFIMVMYKKPTGQPR